VDRLSKRALVPDAVEGSLESSRLGTVRLPTPGRAGVRLSLLNNPKAGTRVGGGWMVEGSSDPDAKHLTNRGQSSPRIKTRRHPGRAGDTCA
jgi:hypothetical protein